MSSILYRSELGLYQDCSDDSSVPTKRLFFYSTYDARSGDLPPHDAISFDSDSTDLIWDTPFTYLTNDMHDAGLSRYLDFCFRGYLFRVSQSEYDRYYKRAFQAHRLNDVDPPLSYNDYIRFLFSSNLRRFLTSWVFSAYCVQLAGPASVIARLDGSGSDNQLSVDLNIFSRRVLDFRVVSDVVTVVFSPVVSDRDPILRSWHKTFVQYFQDRRDHFVVKSDRLRAGVAPCDVDVDDDFIL